MLAETALESVQDVTIRRGWFASTLTVQTVQGAAFKVRGLNRHQASYVRGAMLDAAAVRAAAAAQELVKVDEALHRLLQRVWVSKTVPAGAGNSAVVVDLPRCGPMLSPRVPNLVPTAGPRMERETPGQRPRPNYGHPQANNVGVRWFNPPPS